MKLNFKPAIESTEQLNLRIPASLKGRMDNTRMRAKSLGIDYNATLVANLEEFEKEFAAHVTAAEQAAKQAATRSASTSLADLIPPNPDTPSSNGIQRDRA